MCWTTLLVHKCSLANCPTASQSFKKTIALAPCCHRENLGKHMPWPKGCSFCWDVFTKKKKTDPHVTPFDHRVIEEQALVARRAICTACQRREGIEELQISKENEDELQQEIIQPIDRVKIFCTILKIKNPRTTDLAGAIASTLEPIRLQNGLAPHAFTAACIYAASHIAPCPDPLSMDWLITTFNLKNRVWFLHTYTSLFTHRHQISQSGVVQHGAILNALPKPCCQRPQNRHCPRTKNAWGYEEDKCTGVQVEGLHVMGAFVAFRDHLNDAGLPVNVPKEAYYKESDLELLRNEKTEEQKARDAPRPAR